MQVWWVKIGDFRQITGISNFEPEFSHSYISKTVKDRHVVSIKVEQGVVCALSNGDIAADLECPLTAPFSAFYTAIHSFVTGEPRDFKFDALIYHSKSHPADEKYSLKGAWSRSREQFLHCGLRKFRHSKSSVYRWYPKHVRGRFVYDTYRAMEATRSRHGWVHMFITHRPTVTLQLHNFDFVTTCRTSSFCTGAWQLARFQLTRRITRSLGDSWASCRDKAGYLSKVADFDPPHLHLAPP